jgi:hypothetical protein
MKGAETVVRRTGAFVFVLCQPFYSLNFIPYIFPMDYR